MKRMNDGAVNVMKQNLSFIFTDHRENCRSRYVCMYVRIYIIKKKNLVHRFVIVKSL